MRIVIMMGPSGSGKSTWIADNLPGALVCSADDVHMQDGVYRFCAALLAMGHAECLRKYVGALSIDRATPVVVDNTNTTIAELAPYVALAQAYGVTPEIVCMYNATDPEKPDALVYFKRNVHNVPFETVFNHCRNIAKTLQVWPRHWPKPTFA